MTAADSILKLNTICNVAPRNAANAGMIEGPRIAGSGRCITTCNAIALAFPSFIEHPASSFGVLCNPRDEMTAETRKQLKDGVDLIKVAGDGDSLTSDGFLTGTIDDHDLRAVARLAHMMGKRCTIHARSGILSLLCRPSARATTGPCKS